MLRDDLRSLAVLGMGFIAVLAFTLGSAAVVQSRPAGPTPLPLGEAGAAGPVEVTREYEIGALPTEVGGTLAVSGDREGSFAVNSESIGNARPVLIDGRYVLVGGRYGLIGDDGRIFFAGDPLAVEQMNFDGLSFFPEPDECTITPGRLNADIGVAGAHLVCTDLADVRGSGVITIEGTIGLPGDLLGMRGDLPPAGGTIEVGGETLTFSEAFLDTAPSAVIGGTPYYAMQLSDEDRGMALGFAYDVQTHRLTLAHVMRDGIGSDVGEDACTLGTRELGKLNPRVTVVELSVQCAAVDVPGLGTVAISGTVIVEQVEP